MGENKFLAGEVYQELIGKTYKEIVENLVIDEDQGDCCGYASCEVTQDIPQDVDLNSLVLKGCVELTRSCNYSDESTVNYSDESTVFNFVFSTPDGDELVLGYTLDSGSGSGWNYGQYAKLSYKDKELISV